MKQTLRYELVDNSACEVRRITASVERGYDIVSSRVKDGVLTIIANKREGAQMQFGNLYTPNDMPKAYEMPNHSKERPKFNVPVGFSMKRMAMAAKREKCLF